VVYDFPALTAFQRDSESNHWWAKVPGADFDIYLPDAQGSPDASKLAFAKTALAAANELVLDATKYIATFVDTDRVGIIGTPEIVTIDCSEQQYGAESVKLDVTWPDQDVYGLWYATFQRLSGMSWCPCEFGRRNW
jgi:hypothetical protein